MGERLVVEIKRNNELVATAYYHWSAYTQPALNILKSMYDHVLSKANDMTDDQLQLALIRFAERSTYLGYFETIEERDEAMRRCKDDNADKPDAVQKLMEDLVCQHGGLDPCDENAALSKFTDEAFETENVSRNEGLIAITYSSMCDQLRWAEGVVTVDLDDNQVLNGIVYEYDESDYMAEMEDWEDEFYVDPNDLPQSPIDLGKFKLNEAALVAEIVQITQSSWIRFGDKIYQLKES